MAHYESLTTNSKQSQRSKRVKSHKALHRLKLCIGSIKWLSQQQQKEEQVA